MTNDIVDLTARPQLLVTELQNSGVSLADAAAASQAAEAHIEPVSTDPGDLKMCIDGLTVEVQQLRAVIVSLVEKYFRAEIGGDDPVYASLYGHQ